jgi:lipopolysaccharide biosynthesis glycosyltransferase
MPSADPLVLVCGADDRYATALAVTLHSALVHLSSEQELQLYVIDGGIDGDHRRKLQRTVERSRPDVSIGWHRPATAELGDLWVSGHVSMATYFSLLVPEVVPERFDRAIYLDCDVLVESDLAELWETPLEERALLAVQDCLIPYVSSPGGPVRRGVSDVSSAPPYFNAGVLLLNLARWRAEGISERVFRYLRDHHRELTFWDQEGLNAVLAGDVGLLDPKWNVPTSLLWLERWPESSFKERLRGLREDLLRRPAIWHFVGPSKPWSGGFTHPAGERWHQHRHAAGWPAPPTSDTAGDLCTWLEEQRLDDAEIADVVPANASLILVSDACHLPMSVRGRRALPFLERDGVYQGNPADDDQAIRELDRMRRSGSRFIVFDRSSLWWLGHYHGFAHHLQSAHACIRQSDRLAIFQLSD